jgi:hypothetical protein
MQVLIAVTFIEKILVNKKTGGVEAMFNQL